MCAQISIDGGKTFVILPEGTEIVVEGIAHYNGKDRFTVKLNDEGVLVRRTDEEQRPGEWGGAFEPYEDFLKGNNT